MRRRLRINQIAADFSRKPISESRVLDIASYEGYFSEEFALRGAEVLGVEGRLTNIRRGEERIDLSSLPNLKFVHDDVRNISKEKYGEFDIILCLGLLYHLDSPDCFTLLESIAEMCTGVAIFDTHIGFTRKRKVRHKGNDYWGWQFTEYDKAPTLEETEESTWSSIGNVKAFWPTKPSLVNAMVDAGFNSVYESQFPAWNDMPSDRIALVGLKGKTEPILGKDFDEDFDESIVGERVDELPRVGAIYQDHPIYSALKLKANRIARRLGLRKANRY